MALSLADQLRADLARLEAATAHEAAMNARPRLAKLLNLSPKPAAAAKAVTVATRRDRRSDLTVAALGVTLGLICALFPWYIFLNPDEFGIRAIEFTGDGDYRMGGTAPLTPQPDRFGELSDMRKVETEGLDPLSTGTTEKPPVEEPPAAAGGHQPFPQEPVVFDVIEIANGRAMLEDDSGIFLVQQGSLLPDASHVKSIEQRDDHWVVVTSADRVLRIAH